MAGLAGCGQKDQGADAVTPVVTKQPQELEANIEFDSAANGNETQNTEAQITPEISAENSQDTSGTGSEGAGSNSNQQDSLDQTAAPISGIYDQICQKVELVSPMQPTADFIYNYYGIATDSLDDYVFSLSEESISAETIIIIRCADDATRAAAKSSLEVLREDKLMELQDYLPDQYTLVERASVVEKGDYVYLVISENDSAIIAIIEENL